MKKFRLLAVAAVLSLAAVGLTASTAVSQTTDPNNPDRGLEQPPGDGTSTTIDVGTDDRDNAGDGGGALDQVINDDLIVDGSACVGQDCVNGESFGFDTIRLKENNLRIKFQDTSTTSSFPSNDWQITINDSSNGGANKFSIDDIDGGRTPFTIEAGAPSHSLYVDDGGRIGFGTNNPVADLHVKSGNTPTTRLEQDGSSGFGTQTWDVAGNEANFFIRDATNGSTLPFRIFPGAPSNALVIEASGDIGMGTTSPEYDFELQRSDGIIAEFQDTGSNFIQLRLVSDSPNNKRIIATNVAGIQQSQISFEDGCIEFLGATAATVLGHVNLADGFAAGPCP